MSAPSVGRENRMKWRESIALIPGAAAGSPAVDCAAGMLDLGVIALSFVSNCEQL
jgi:hypothetical protein